MKILYIDMGLILYSDDYLNRNENVRELFETNKHIPSKDIFLERVRPDRESAQRLASVAYNSRVLVYPSGIKYSRASLINHKIFSEEQLAPYIDLRVVWGKLDSTDNFRLMTAHAEALKAQWFMHGSGFSDEVIALFPQRYISSGVEGGVTDELIQQIRAIDLT